MTRKDYKMLAELIRNGFEPVEFTNRLMDILQKDNPRFDRAIFLDACGLTKQTEKK